MMPGIDPRQMAMMMRKMGVEMRDIEGVQEVLVRTATKEYRFRKASVSVMKAQGTETWQVQGKPEVVDRAAGTAGTPGQAADGQGPLPPGHPSHGAGVPSSPSSLSAFPPASGSASGGPQGHRAGAGLPQAGAEDAPSG